MANPDAIHVNNAGTALRATVIDQDGNAVDLSPATAKEIWVSKPDGSEALFPAAFMTDGTDGIVQYVTVRGDLDQPGRWKLQAVIVMGGGLLHSDVHVMKVVANLRSD